MSGHTLFDALPDRVFLARAYSETSGRWVDLGLRSDSRAADALVAEAFERYPAHLTHAEVVEGDDPLSFVPARWEFPAAPDPRETQP